MEGEGAIGLDLLRCESIASLDPATIARVLQKNYRCVCVGGCVGWVGVMDGYLQVQLTLSSLLL